MSWEFPLTIYTFSIVVTFMIEWAKAFNNNISPTVIQCGNVSNCRGRRGRDRIVVGFATFYAIRTYHH